jgi:hypothetical protein
MAIYFLTDFFLRVDFFLTGVGVTAFGASRVTVGVTAGVGSSTAAANGCPAGSDNTPALASLSTLFLEAITFSPR